MKVFSAKTQDSVQAYLATRPFAQLALTIGTLVSIFVVLDRWILTLTALPQESYFESFLFIELLNNTFSSPLLILLSSLVIGFSILRIRPLWIPWSQLEHSKYIRPFILLLAALLSWWYTTYDYNLYVNQSHYYDRFLIIALAILIAWRPFFVLPFLLLLTAVIWQFAVPLDNSYSFAQPSMPLRILVMFVAMLFFYALTGKQKVNDWLFLSLCIIAAHYWAPGLAKMVLNWGTYGHVYHLLPTTYANGWLAFLDPSQLSSFALTLAKFDGFIRISTLVLQLCALALLWSRFSLSALLTFWTIFHIGIFATSGILFWQWIMIEIFILILIQSLWKNNSLPFISRDYFLLSVFLIGSSIHWVNPVRLAWYDTPVSYTFRCEAIGKSGEKYVLPPRFFAPYDYPFTLGKFIYLTPSPRLDLIWGSTGNREIADQLLQVKSEEEIHHLEKELGQRYYDQSKSEVFDHFIRQFVLNANKRESKSTLFNAIQAPRQLWTFPKGTNTEYDFQEPISIVNIYQVTSWFDGKNYLEIENKVIRHIPIGDPL